MHRFVLAVASIALATSASLAAQEPDVRLGPGQRVRVTVPRYEFARVVGTVVDIRPDTLYVRWAQRRFVGSRETRWDSVTSAVPIAAIERLEVSQGRRSRWLLGLGLGVAVGGATGALVGYASGDDESGFLQFSAGDKAVMLGVALGAVGGVVGLVTGALSRGDRWQEVPRDRIRVTVAPTRTGVFLGARLAF